MHWTKRITLIKRDTETLPGGLANTGLSGADVLDYFDHAIATTYSWFGAPRDDGWGVSLAAAWGSKVMRYRLFRYYPISIDSAISHREDALFALGWLACDRTLMARASRGEAGQIARLLAPTGGLEVMKARGLAHSAALAASRLLTRRLSVALPGGLQRICPQSVKNWQDSPRLAIALRAVCTWQQLLRLGTLLSWRQWLAGLDQGTSELLDRALSPLGAPSEGEEPSKHVAYAWLALGYPAQAAREYQRWLADHADDALSTCALAMALCQAGDTEGASGARAHVRRLAPGQPVVVWNGWEVPWETTAR